MAKTVQVLLVGQHKHITHDAKLKVAPGWAVLTYGDGSVKYIPASQVQEIREVEDQGSQS